MFSAKTYTARRSELRTKIGQGIVLLPGNGLAPNNYPNNAYYFRQDSSFLYYFGLNTRSEERRVGKECRSRWSPYH